MYRQNIKTLLLITSSGLNSIYPFLFQFAKYWAKQGQRLLYVSKIPLENIPPSVGKIINLQVHDLKLMQFMYLPQWTDLLTQLATIRIRRFRVNAIIIDNLANYFEEFSEKSNYEIYVSQICATLLHSISTIEIDCSDSLVLFCGYVNKNSSIEKTIIKNFFHNVWKVETILKENISRKEYKLYNMFATNTDKTISTLSFIDNNEFLNNQDRSKAKLELSEVIQILINM